MAKPYQKITKKDILNEIHENEQLNQFIWNRLVDFCDGCFDCNCDNCSFFDATNEAVFDYFNMNK